MAAAEFMSMAAVPEPPALPTNAYNTSTWNAGKRMHDQPLNLERFCVWYACQDTLMQAMFRHYHVTVHKSGRSDEWINITPKPQLCMQAGYWGQLCHEMCDDHRCSRCSQQEGGYSFFHTGPWECLQLKSLQIQQLRMTPRVQLLQIMDACYNSKDLALQCKQCWELRHWIISSEGSRHRFMQPPLPSFLASAAQAQLSAEDAASSLFRLQRGSN